MRKENFNEEKCSSPGIFSSSPGGGGLCVLREAIPRGNREVLLCGDEHKFAVLAGSASRLSGRGQGAGRKG